MRLVNEAKKHNFSRKEFESRIVQIVRILCIKIQLMVHMCSHCVRVKVTFWTMQFFIVPTCKSRLCWFLCHDAIALSLICQSLASH